MLADPATRDRGDLPAMTFRDRFHAPPSPLVPRIADVLRSAGEDGLTLREIEAQAGTRWALRVICSMCRHGYNIGEQDGRYVLVVEPAGAERAVNTTALPPVAGGEGSLTRPSSPVDGSLSTGRLFELPCESHYTAEAA
jgi:hypothetical protein